MNVGEAMRGAKGVVKPPYTMPQQLPGSHMMMVRAILYAHASSAFLSPERVLHCALSLWYVSTMPSNVLMVIPMLPCIVMVTHEMPCPALHLDRAPLFANIGDINYLESHEGIAISLLVLEVSDARCGC